MLAELLETTSYIARNMPSGSADSFEGFPPTDEIRELTIPKPLVKQFEEEGIRSTGELRKAVSSPHFQKQFGISEMEMDKIIEYLQFADLDEHPLHGSIYVRASTPFTRNER